MERIRGLSAVLAALALLAAWRARAVDIPPAGLPCAPGEVRTHDGRVACGGEGDALTGSQARVLGLPLDLNRATEAELEALPGIGPALAARIIRVREASGPYRSVDDLERVQGIGPIKRAALAERVTVR